MGDDSEMNIRSISKNIQVQQAIKPPCSFELCSENNIKLPDYEYSEEDFAKLKDYRVFFAALRKKVGESNQEKLTMTLQNKLVSALYREFKYMSPGPGSGKGSGEKSAGKSSSRSQRQSTSGKSKSSAGVVDDSQTVPPIKIRLQRETKKNVSLDSDAEFEERIRAMEKADEEKEQKKINRKKEKEAKKKQKEIEKAEKAANKGSGDEDEEEDEEETPEQEAGRQHYEYCMVCKYGGDLLLCDTCP